MTQGGSLALPVPPPLSPIPYLPSCSEVSLESLLFSGENNSSTSRLIVSRSLLYTAAQVQMISALAFPTTVSKGWFQESSVEFFRTNDAESQCRKPMQPFYKCRAGRTCACVPTIKRRLYIIMMEVKLK